MGKKDKDDDRKSEPSERSPSSAAPGRSGSSSPSQPTRSAPVVREVSNPNVVASYRDHNSWQSEGAPRMLGETTGGVAQPVNLAGNVQREPGTNPAVKPDTDKPVAPAPVAPTPAVVRKKRGTGLRLSPINTRVPERSKGPRKDATRSVHRSKKPVLKKKASPPLATKGEDAARRGAKPPKSALSSPPQGRSTSARAARSSDHRDARQEPVARSSDHRDAQQDQKRVCKERPTDTKPKRGGGGGKKREFVPWCR